MFLKLLKFGTPLGVVFTIADVLSGGQITGWIKNWIDGELAKPEIQAIVSFVSDTWTTFLESLGIGGTNEDGTQNEGISVEVTPEWIADPIKHLQDTLVAKFAEEGVGFTITEGNLTVTLAEGVISFDVPGWETLKASIVDGFFGSVDEETLNNFIPRLKDLGKELTFLGGGAALAALGMGSFADEAARLFSSLTGDAADAAYATIDKLTTVIENFNKAIRKIGEYIAAHNAAEGDTEKQQDIRWGAAQDVGQGLVDAGGFIGETILGEELTAALEEDTAERLRKQRDLDSDSTRRRQYEQILQRYDMQDTEKYGEGNFVPMSDQIDLDNPHDTWTGRMNARANEWAAAANKKVEDILFGEQGLYSENGILHDLYGKNGLIGGLFHKDQEIKDQDSGGISVGRTLRWLSYNNRPEAIIPLHRFDEVMRPFMNQMMPMAAGGGTVQIDQRVGDIVVNVSGSGGDPNAIAREVGAEVRKQFRDLADEMDSAVRR